MTRYEQLEFRLVNLIDESLVMTPALDKFERWSSLVAFEVCRLTKMTPEGWEKLSPVAREPWLEEAIRLRIEDGPFLVSLRELERITHGRVTKKTLDNNPKPPSAGNLGQTLLYRYADYVALWPANREPLPNEAEARQILKERKSN